MWNIGLSTGACTHRSILDVLPSIRESGASTVEISTPPRHFDPWKAEETANLATGLLESGLSAVSIHAPFGGRLDLASPDPQDRREAVDAALAAAAVIARLGGRLVVAHPSDLERSAHDVTARLADSARSLEQIARQCQESGLTLAIETPLPHLIGGSPDEFRWLLGALDSSVGACLDTGHLALGGIWQELVGIASGRIVHIHAHDNHGHRDDHLPPGDGGIDWTEISRGLRAAGFNGWIMLELLCPPDSPGAYFTRAVQRTRDILDGVAVS